MAPTLKDWPAGIYQTILVDPPWPQPMSGARKRPKKGGVRKVLPYPTMTLAQIKGLPVGDLAGPGSHLWLWTTNAFLPVSFGILTGWGFRYLCPVTWVKPNGIGNWFVHRTEHLIFGYRPPLRMVTRYKANVIFADRKVEGISVHSRKPDGSYELIEQVSHEPRLELFARRTRPGWQTWGNDVRPSERFDFR